MQQKTGVFEAGFCKNTVYRFLNNTKTNWLRFTTILSARIINSFMKPLTSDTRKDVFIIDDSLFDSWFSSPKSITAIKQEEKLDVIAMVKKSSKVKYGYQGKMLNIKEIYRKNRKRRGRSRYLLSIEVTIGTEAIPANHIFIW